MIVDKDKDGVDDFAELKLEVAEDGWKNRRAIAWISFLVCVFYPIFIVVVFQFSSTLVDKLLELSVPIFTLAGANLTWYFTMSTWEDINKKRGSN